MHSRWWSVLLLLGVGCGAGAPNVRPAPAVEEEEGVRMKGGLSPSARVPILLARGEFAEAEVLITELAKSGQLEREQEERLRDLLRRAKEPRPEPGREPFPVDPREPKEGPPRQAPSCETKYPNHPMCWDLPEEYTFASVRLALEAMKQRLGQKNLSLHSDSSTDTGPCPNVGSHFNVRLNGKRMGSITCCNCCVSTAAGPLEWEKCRIVW